MMQAILTQEFYRDGRGPELQAVHYSDAGRRPRAVEYFNPDDAYLPETFKHLRFEGVQVWMFTPDEVYNYELDLTSIVPANAAAICLGKSDWLQSFAPQHLTECQHFQLTFYDEVLDVICERITFGQGRFPEK